MESFYLAHHVAEWLCKCQTEAPKVFLFLIEVGLIWVLSPVRHESRNRLARDSPISASSRHKHCILNIHWKTRISNTYSVAAPEWCRILILNRQIWLQERKIYDGGISRVCIWPYERNEVRKDFGGLQQCNTMLETGELETANRSSLLQYFCLFGLPSQTDSSVLVSGKKNFVRFSQVST